jgi:hypothetical protein
VLARAQDTDSHEAEAVERRGEHEIAIVELLAFFDQAELDRRPR